MGAYCIPDVNDEVVVAFLGGQLDKPVIVGGVWSKTSKPPKDNEKGKNHTKMVKTKSGHTVTFSDEKDKEKIHLVRPNIKLEELKKLIKTPATILLEGRLPSSLVKTASKLN